MSAIKYTLYNECISSSTFYFLLVVSKIFDIFNKLSDELNQTLLIVTHDPSFAERTHRIIKMEDGKILPSDPIVLPMV